MPSLIGRAQRGDEEAFASLAVAVGDRLHAVAHRILRDLDLAEDATQHLRSQPGWRETGSNRREGALSRL